MNDFEISEMYNKILAINNFDLNLHKKLRIIIIFIVQFQFKLFINMQAF